MNTKLVDKLFQLKAEAEEESEAIKVIQHEADLKMEGSKDRLETIGLEIAKVQESIIVEMEKESVKTITHDNKNVTSSVRRTLTIVDEELVIESLLDSKLTAKVKKATGLTQKDIKDKMYIQSLNKPFAKEIAENLKNVEGIQLPGTDIKETKYLTIK